MTAPSTQIAERTPAEAIVAQIRSDRFRAELQLALPANVSVDRFTRATVTALMQNPDLATVEDKQSLYLAVVRCAQMGLMPDGRQAAIVVFNTKVKDGGKDRWVKKAQAIEMIYGLRHIAAEHGWTLRTAVVYEHDEFDYQLGLDEHLTHRPVKPGVARGEISAAYAIGVHRDGRRQFEVLTKEDIDKVRASSKAAGKGPWVDWFEQMAEKTAGRRLFKKLPLDPADVRVRRLLEDEERGPGDAERMLYGPSSVGSAALDRMPGDGGADGSQQAGADDEPPGSDAPAPGADDFGAAADEEPPEAAEGDVVDLTEQDVQAAQEAAGRVVSLTKKDSWAHGLTLAQINADERFEAFFRWALGPGLEDGDLKAAVVAYAKVRLPFLHDELVGSAG